MESRVKLLITLFCAVCLLQLCSSMRIKREDTSSNSSSTSTTAVSPVSSNSNVSSTLPSTTEVLGKKANETAETTEARDILDDDGTTVTIGDIPDDEDNDIGQDGLTYRRRQPDVLKESNAENSDNDLINSDVGKNADVPPSDLGDEDKEDQDEDTDTRGYDSSIDDTDEVPVGSADEAKDVQSVGVPPMDDTDKEDSDGDSNTSEEDESYPLGCGFDNIDDCYPFQGGFVFDYPFGEVYELQQYFNNLRIAMERIFAMTLADIMEDPNTFTNTTDKVVEVDGRRYKVRTTLVKGGDQFNSMALEAVSVLPMDARRRRRSLPAKMKFN